MSGADQAAKQAAEQLASQGFESLMACQEKSRNPVDFGTFSYFLAYFHFDEDFLRTNRRTNCTEIQSDQGSDTLGKGVYTQNKMIMEAIERGVNAIIGIDCESSAGGGGVMHISMIGTAVKVKKIDI